MTRNKVIGAIAGLLTFGEAGLLVWEEFGTGKHYQRQCTNQLRDAYKIAVKYQAEKHTLVADFAELGFKPEPGRYLFVADVNAGGFVRADPRSGMINGDGLGLISEVVEVGISGTCPSCSLTIACAGNIDSDGILDVWSISTADRIGRKGTLPAGKLVNHVDDLTNWRMPMKIALP